MAILVVMILPFALCPHLQEPNTEKIEALSAATKNIDKSVYVLETSLFIVLALAAKKDRLLAFIQHSKGVNSRLAIGTYIRTLIIKLSDILQHLSNLAKH